MEVLRRGMVRDLVQRMLATIKKHAVVPVAPHLVVELLTGWVLHERNDPSHESSVFALQRPSGALVTPNNMYDDLYPLHLLRSRVLASDVGADVLVKATQEKMNLGELVNSWRGSLVSDKGERREEELVDLALAVSADHVLDVLIPSPDLEPRGSSTAVFVRMMKWCGDKALASTATGEVTSIVRAVRQELFTKSLQIYSCTAGLRSVSFSMRKSEICGEQLDTVEICYGPLRCPMLFRAWSKMKALYDAANPPSEQSDASFACRLLVVLLRYASLSGASVQNVDQTAGFHAAVPPKIYSKLRQSLNTVLEGFASPMNSTSTYFCSLFPDCDSYFGSLGSFFHLSVRRDFPNGVSMTCNPPYSVIVMTRVAAQLSQMFDEADELQVPLQVFIVVCNWSSVGGTSGKNIIDSLHNHRACVRHVSLSPNRAPFQDGHAFVLNRPFFTLGTNTEVFLFQNAKAHQMWPAHRDAGFDSIVSDWQNLQVEEGSAKRPRE